MGNGSFAGVCRQQFQDRIDAMRVAAHLGIPFRTWDLSREYRAAVVDYLIREYAAGRTPNPDVMCNRRIKFGIFLERALEAGADYIATGHYARLMRSGQGSVNNEQSLLLAPCSLFTGVDFNKDQSYFLWTLWQEELRRTLFPVGEFTKPEVREMARKFGLPTAEKPDSQGICFIGEINVREFLQQHIPSERGKVLTASGKAVGEHQGAAFYTIGQRHGIGTGGRPALPGEPRPAMSGAGGIPYYVIGKDMAANTLTVAEGPYDKHLFRAELEARSAHWVAGRVPSFPLRCSARIRYRQPLQTCIVTNHKSLGTGATIREASFRVTNGSMTHDQLLVHFDEPQRAVTPGQSIVFYRGEVMLGGAIIQ